VEKRERTPEPSDEAAPRFIVQCYLFGWGLFFPFNKLSPKAYLPNEYYLLNFLQASLQKQVSWFNYQLWRREGT